VTKMWNVGRNGTMFEVDDDDFDSKNVIGD
jgi:hypothetical protein